ncbi:aminotransferase class III-fold pyridoxal phosphate-dependent enzyme [Streptomyces jeddahensis]|uniref:Beta-alanine--pyruvate aminotransferase n=1 Tax=Streptomyces jeddahensis TaxID=1716141 RepID=A0A177HRB3_9ACTN|nr:aminotransferase class III-fold pyridoxal phosphate-dependent enzyme [Streptomyces jeddahensis]OAH12754.1 beta-alanine--pyruvate aminotransferase [Streptomyces jeddahensis]
MAGSTPTAATEQKAHEDERYGPDPDLVVFAKGVTSGYAPLGGVLLSPRIRQPFCRDCEQTPVFRHGATYAGHATAGALPLRDIDILEEEKLLPRVAELDVLLTEELTRLRLPEAVTDTRVAGLLGGVALASHLSAETAPTSSSSAGSSPARCAATPSRAARPSSPPTTNSASSSPPSTPRRKARD